MHPGREENEFPLHHGNRVVQVGLGRSDGDEGDAVPASHRRSEGVHPKEGLGRVALGLQRLQIELRYQRRNQ